MIGIYIYEFPNGKHYVGQAVDLAERHKQHLRKSSHQLVDEKIREYGILDTTEFETNEECIDFIEWYYINFIYCSLVKDGEGYNILTGGRQSRGRKFTDEHKKNISINHADVSGENNPMYGVSIKFSDERKLQYSEKFSGENNPMYGKNHSEKSIEQNRINQPNRKSVLCIELNIEFPSSNAAAEYIKQNYNPKAAGTNIRAAIKKNQKAYGFNWIYI